jgi:hypothetical protein
MIHKTCGLRSLRPWLSCAIFLTLFADALPAAQARKPAAKSPVVALEKIEPGVATDAAFLLHDSIRYFLLNLDPVTRFRPDRSVAIIAALHSGGVDAPLVLHAAADTSVPTAAGLVFVNKVLLPALQKSFPDLPYQAIGSLRIVHFVDDPQFWASKHLAQGGIGDVTFVRSTDAKRDHRVWLPFERTKRIARANLKKPPTPGQTYLSLAEALDHAERFAPPKPSAYYRMSDVVLSHFPHEFRESPPSREAAPARTAYDPKSRPVAGLDDSAYLRFYQDKLEAYLARASSNLIHFAYLNTETFDGTRLHHQRARIANDASILGGLPAEPRSPPTGTFAFRDDHVAAIYAGRFESQQLGLMASFTSVVIGKKAGKALNAVPILRAFILASSEKYGPNQAGGSVAIQLATAHVKTNRIYQSEVKASTGSRTTIYVGAHFRDLPHLFDVSERALGNTTYGWETVDIYDHVHAGLLAECRRFVAAFPPESAPHLHLIRQLRAFLEARESERDKWDRSYAESVTRFVQQTTTRLLPLDFYRRYYPELLTFPEKEKRGFMAGGTFDGRFVDARLAGLKLNCFEVGRVALTRLLGELHRRKIAPRDLTPAILSGQLELCACDLYFACFGLFAGLDDALRKELDEDENSGRLRIERQCLKAWSQHFGLLVESAPCTVMISGRPVLATGRDLALLTSLRSEVEELGLAREIYNKSPVRTVEEYYRAVIQSRGQLTTARGARR